MKRKACVIPVPYPTDNNHEPVHPYELGYTPEWELPDAQRNNHHHAFFARSFGLTALGLLYRNLEIMQTPLILTEHTQLHKAYTGFKVPSRDVMADRIEEQYENGGCFKVCDRELGKYVLNRITDEDIERLKIAIK